MEARENRIRRAAGPRACARVCAYASIGVWQRRTRKKFLGTGRATTYASALFTPPQVKSGRASAQAVWLRRRRSSINEPIASPPSATTGMTKRTLRIVPPHCRSDGKSTAAGNLNHLSRPDGSCLAGWRAARNSRWNCLSLWAASRAVKTVRTDLTGNVDLADDSVYVQQV
jgi:hypothetical protein